MRLLILSADDIHRALPMPDAIDAMKTAFAELASGGACSPPRLHVPVGDAVTLAMAAHGPESGLAAKIVSVFPANRDKGLPAVTGIVIAFDPETGLPTAILDGTALTAWRTGAASGAATDLLANPDARTGAIIGSGPQARTQAIAIDAARDLESIRVHSLDTPDQIRSFVEETQPHLGARLQVASSSGDAVRDADVICTATSARAPVVSRADLKPGAHISAVGSFTLDMRELDDDTIAEATVFIDEREAALAEAGELVGAWRAGRSDPDRWIELGRVASGDHPGRTSRDEITLFKSVGNAIQDAAAASATVRRAGDLGLGRRIEM
jgi:ornithine cyclodeaminase/alanine dehydrogenase-like protein (mu-crystallin family)